jgi:predicted anti-sigma-YlaC factor YlaD
MKNPSPTRRWMMRLLFKLPNMISCIEFEAFVLDYFEEELTSRQRSMFELHLKVCPECRTYLRHYRETVVLLKTSSRSIDQTRTQQLQTVPEDLIAAIIEARQLD